MAGSGKPNRYDGGQRAAVPYSLIESTKRAGVEPWVYMRELLTRIDTHSAIKIAELTPCHRKPTVWTSTTSFNSTVESQRGSESRLWDGLTERLRPNRPTFVRH